MTGLAALIDRLKPGIVVPPAEVECPSEDVTLIAVEKAWATGHAAMVETATSLSFAAPATSTEAGPYLRLVGKYVEADRPNRNKAMWTADGLEMGLPSVTGGPLNWLHQERRIIGALSEARLCPPEGDSNAHIEVAATAWRWLYPSESQSMAQASSDGSLFLSMECTSASVTCVDGCGETFTARELASADPRVCAHVRGRTHVRRFNDPVFLGAGVVVPPALPGWSGARARLV